MAKPKPFFPHGYYQRLFTQAHHAPLASIINDYKQATGDSQSVRGVEDALSLYFSKDNVDFNLTTWRKGLSRTDYSQRSTNHPAASLLAVVTRSESQKVAPQPFSPNGYCQRLFTQEHHAALSNIINDYKQATGEFQSVRGVEDALSLYFSKDNVDFNLTTWRRGLSRADY